MDCDIPLSRRLPDMMTSKAKASALPMIGTPPHRRLWNVLMRFKPVWGLAPASSVAAIADESNEWDEPIVAFACPSQIVDRPRLPRPVNAAENAPIRYLAMGKPSDRKAFTIAIRAFALAGKLGDRLTLVGYGRHRRRLEKWAIALGVYAIVTFAQPDLSHSHGHSLDADAYDTVLLLSPRDDHQIAVLLNGLSSGLRFISMSLEPDIIELLRNCQLGTSIGSGDVLALSSAMLTTKHPNPGVVLARVTRYRADMAI